MKLMYKPTVEQNPFYKKILDVDFSKLKSEKTLKNAFETELGELTNLIQDALTPVVSLTQVAEVFYYSTLAAALLQQKADYRNDEILSVAPKDYSVQTMIMSQFKATKEEGDDDFFEPEHSTNYRINSLAEQMGKPFSYSGKLMRALTMVAVSSVCSCKQNMMANAYTILSDYGPVHYLLESNSHRFPVIGSTHFTESSGLAYTYSVSPRDHVGYVRVQNCAFSKVFADKLAEILALDSMDSIDRARTEELRDFFLDTLVRFFFELRSLNFPRVLSLIDAVSECVKDGSISEEKLDEIAPPECTALLGNESILTKDTVDMSSTWYKVNSGIKNFAQLCNHFKLMSGHKLVLLNSVVDC